MLPRRFAVPLSLWLMCIVLVAGSVFAAQAQAAPRSIPVSGEAIYTRLSPDGHTVAAFENNQFHGDEVLSQYLPIRLIDLVAGKEIAALSGATDYATDVAFSPDGTQLASYHQNGFIYLWTVADGKLIRRIPAIPLPSTRLRFLADGKSVVTTGGPTVLLVWDTESGHVTSVLVRRFDTYKQFKDKVMPQSQDSFVGFDASPDGKTLAMATIFGNVFLWDIASGQETPLRVATEARPKADVMSVVFSQDGKLLVYYDSTSKSVHVWDVASRKEIAAIPADSPMCIALSSNDDTVAWATRQSNQFTLSFASISKPGNPAQITISLGDQSAGVPSLAFTPDGKQVVLSGLWARDTGNNAIYVADVPQS
jgi:WD40 repeat protein